MIHISVYSLIQKNPPAELGGGREEVLRHVEQELYGAAVWDRGWVPGGGWVWQRGHEEGFPSRGISITATI